tara:strand:+ start:78 stop:413 length:336 start_codon:yes stop_codon:yes gene_type:complete
MASVTINEDFYLPAIDIAVDTPRDVVDIMDNNDITPVEILEELEWELPDLQKAARQLDIEYIPFTTTGAGLLHIFKKMETTEQREFLSLITDSIISYYKSDLTLAYPSDIS